MKKFTIGFDLHGIHQDEETVDAFLEFNKAFKPDIKISGGDMFDMTCLRGGASGEDLAESLSDDIDAGFEFLNKYKPKVCLMGNHEYRLDHIIATRDGPVVQYAKEIKNSMVSRMLAMGATVIPFGKRCFFQLGDYKVIHGFHCGITAAKMHGTIYGNVIHGHVHAPDMYSARDIAGTKAYSSGCLCSTDYEYNNTSTASLRHKNGWIYGVITDSGKVQVSQAIVETHNGRKTFTCSTSFREF